MGKKERCNEDREQATEEQIALLSQEGSTTAGRARGGSITANFQGHGFGTTPRGICFAIPLPS